MTRSNKMEKQVKEIGLKAEYAFVRRREKDGVKRLALREPGCLHGPGEHRILNLERRLFSKV